VGALTATLDTKKLRGKVGRGITVYTNDPARPKIFLTVKANILASVQILPHHTVHLTNRRTGAETTRLLVRKDPTEQGTLELSDVSVSEPWLAVSATKLENPLPVLAGLPQAFSGDWLVELSLTGRPKYGRSQQELRFNTGLTREPQVKVAVVANLQPPVVVAPPRLQLAAPPDGRPAEGSVSLSIRPGLDPEALTAEARPAELSVELERMRTRFYKAHVRWNGEGPVDGAVTFQIGEESFELPVQPAAPVTAPGR
jgi:hypothetical protein